MMKFDWTISFGNLIAIASFIIGLLGAWLKFREVHTQINSRMDKFIEEVRASAFERGLRQGVKEQQDKEIV